MKHNRNLHDGIIDLISNMTPAHRANWRRLIAFMRVQDMTYYQSNFSGSNADGGCALSYAIAAGIVPVNHGGPNDFSRYDNIADETFGFGAFDSIFGASSYPDEDLAAHEEHDLADICYHVHGMDNLKGVSSSSVANALEAILDLDDKISKVTVHWKSNQKDNFSSVESLREFMDLNPHRKKGYRKITQTRLVERIIHEEVTETITL